MIIQRSKRYLALVFICICFFIFSNIGFAQTANKTLFAQASWDENSLPFAEPTAILITSDPPGAKVYVDHRYNGKTPVTVSGLPPGDYTVRVVADPDFLVFQQVVNTRGRQPAQLHAVLIPTTMTFFKQGVAFFRTGDMLRAKEAFEHAVHGKPKKIPDALFYLGVIAKNQGDFNVAIELLREHAFYRPDAFRTHYLLGELYEKVNRVDRAATSYKLAAFLIPGLSNKIDTNTPATWGRVKTLERKLAAKPYDSVIELQLGYCYEKKGRLAEAMKHYKNVSMRHNVWLDHE